MTENCAICDLYLTSDVVTVKQKGLQTLLAASQAREDNKSALFKDKQELRLHRKCRLMYIEEKSMAAHKKRNQSDKQNVTFDSGKCIFCNENADHDFLKSQQKYPADRRISVHQITKLDTQETILKAAETHDDDWSQRVLQRIGDVNLLALNAVYHGHCYSKFCHPYRTAGLKRGRPLSLENTNAMDLIYSYLETNTDDCQFSLSDIRNALPNIELPSDQVIKYNLKLHYGDKVIITPGNPSLVCFLSNCVQVIQDSWYEGRNKNDHLEKHRIVDMAAKIILEEIRSRVYETDRYPPPASFLKNAKDDCPLSLLRLLKTIIVSNKTNCEPYEQKCIAISHAIVSAARPRSFISPVLLGLSSLIHHKYASRYLINLLNGMGFCATYDETLKYQVSAIASYVPKNTESHFSQFVFDNADVNIQTLDGHNTFHTIGGIQCLNPPQTQSFNEAIPRLRYVPRSFLNRFDQIPMQIYSKPTISGLSKIIFHPPENYEDLFTITQSDLLWMYGKSQRFPDMPGWNSFMRLTHQEHVTSEQMTDIKPVPFINAPASSHDTILTALQYASDQCKQSNINNCIVTFDQPLFQKAQEIVKSSQDSQISKIILRLGGFHLLMSFMGAVGHIMNGSGLKELWASVYAFGSLDKIMSGHQYDRSVRAHLLTSLALFDLIIKTVDLSLDKKLEIENKIYSLLDMQSSDTGTTSSVLESVVKKFSTSLKELEKRGPTAELWISYFKMSMLIQNFIRAERTGDWALHVNTVKEMLPYFHSAGHFNYAKSATLYLQEMLSLKSSVTPEVFERFVTQKLFTIRRTNNPCSGTWSDMTIEQSLMRTMKTSGGVTQGRGMTDSVLGKWILGLPILHSIAEEVDNFCNGSDDNIPKHKDGSKSRIARDQKDFNCFSKWFEEHYPFPEVETVMSISTGVIGGKNVNPHKAREIGQEIMKRRIGTSFADIKYSRKETIQSLATSSSGITVKDTNVSIDPDLIFKRISFLKKSQEELKQFLKYELSPYPLSLFDQYGLRKTNKSAFYIMFQPVSTEESVDRRDNNAHVIDGGFLIHKVVWQPGLQIKEVCKKYVDYVKKISEPTVVFDGYDKINTKSQERLRRAKGKTYPDVIFDETTEITMSQDKFFSNDKNKSRFINFLIRRFKSEGIAVLQSSEDADTLIISTAVNIAETQNYKKVTIIGEDIDLLVILTSKQVHNVSFLKPGKGRVATKLYKANSFNGDPQIVLFAHAFTGCDTTSAIFRQGKKKACSKIMKNANLKDTVNIFNNSAAEPNDVVKAGEKFFCELYGGNIADINILRYEKFAQSITKSSVDLASLPPTASAARQHSLRVYYQVQKWLGNELDPINWGWELQESSLVPIKNLENLAPDDVLKIISCKCKLTCKGTCTCIKAGLKCSSLCVNCIDKTCTSIKVTLESEDDHDGDMEIQLNNLNDYTITDETECNDEETVSLCLESNNSFSKRPKIS